MNYVTYWEIMENNGKFSRIKWFGRACFSDLTSKMACGHKAPKYIRYAALIDKTLTLDQVKFYLNFIEQILEKKYFSYRFGNSLKAKYVIFQLKAAELEQCKKILLYLTAFRYLDEFAPIIIKFYEERNKLNFLSQKFKYFQELHSLAANYKIANCGGVWGHGLVANPIFKPITLKDFRRNLKNSSIHTVHKHFELVNPKPMT